MDIIFVGLFTEKENKDKLEDLLKSCDLEIEWNYWNYNIESYAGIKLLEKVYNIELTGVLTEKKVDSSFTSYPLVYEISEFVIKEKKYPRLFRFFDKIKESDIKKMIIAFADYWNEKTLVRIKKIKIENLKKELNSIYSWCETYVNLRTNEELRNDEHPLILEVDCT